ncbi:MAG: GntR family transcriptional regulator [Burkholderiales bacterium PBB5]|nr:MAG: GntR family transcriptional regulator [Burkholderiales bacterium PBB5]
MGVTPLPIDTAQGQSRYGALAAALRRRILSGEWPPAHALPAEASLASEHGVALGTLRQALALLAQEGLIERVHGRGTFVRGGLSGAPMLRFFRFGEAPGQVPASRILARALAPAPAEVARRLALGRGDEVLRLQRLRLLQGQPCLLEDIWLPLPLFDALRADDIAQWDDLLYPMYARRCGVHVTRAVDEIGFAPLSAAQAAALQLSAGHPGAVVTRQAHDLAGRCVELRTSRGDANAFHYTVTIT